jgi:hypothetical protein
MVWDCFTGTAVYGSLYFLLSKTTMNAQRFIEDKLVFWMRHHYPTHFLWSSLAHPQESDCLTQGGEVPCDGLAQE